MKDKQPRSVIPYGKQFIDHDDLTNIQEALQEVFLTTGPRLRLFEEQFASKVGAKYAVAVSSGTAALHLSCLAAGLGKGDELITSPLTFAASANCALYCNAKPVFVDVTKDGLIDVDAIKTAINPNTKIIVPVHYMGLPCDMKKIQHLASFHNLTIIEDACHALGATYNDTTIGDCTYSDMTVFSFHPVKHITTGEGGIITTNSKKWYDVLCMLRHHGMTKDADLYEFEAHGPWYHEMQKMGFNYRLSDIHAALGTTQLQKLDQFLSRRHEIAKRYHDAFENRDEIKCIAKERVKENAFHLFVILLENNKIRKELYLFLREHKIYCQVHYIPVYWHPYYQRVGFAKGLCPTVENFYERCLSLPMYYSLSSEDQDFVIAKIIEFFDAKRGTPVKIVESNHIKKTETISFKHNNRNNNNNDTTKFDGKIALGTVQFGIDYGINNTRGKVPEEEVAKILSHAHENGVTILDTASAYGNSETLLGKHASSSLKIVTKLGKEDIISLDYAFDSSLARLQRQSVYACLFHHFDTFLAQPSFWETFLQWKQEGKVQKIGFSLYSPDELDYLLDNNVPFDIVQVPFSIFDQRFAPYFSLLQERGIEIHVRSVFLQGLFFKSPTTLPPFFDSVSDKIKAIQTLAREKNVPLATLCLSFALLHPSIDNVVIGVDSLSNLQQNLDWTSHLETIRTMQETLRSFACHNDQIILPTYWPPK
ncbi:TPA: UDP-4-amino-4,6-dideoxy-N-acetyl-beta-L-altrosamine transaminase [Candidatus Woesearchaeota archaeon]|nr:UDP-4-amino-4,6-dideoxy-N-acetyl-beta-L-altrosamine transaminase [archaeon]HIJ11325.1 UDP-4-amino-4,6-dideoxy-N-acetyl-beta-L-altrosamine transaminase [Candidatus Woesearchaeota archaeon]